MGHTGGGNVGAKRGGRSRGRGEKIQAGTIELDRDLRQERSLK